MDPGPGPVWATAGSVRPMAASEPGAAAARLAKGFTAKAKRAAATLKAEYEAGKRGDDTVAEPIWSTPKEQLDGLLALLRSSPSGADAAPPEAPVAAAGEADEIAAALRGVDWAGVRHATSGRTNDATKAMRAMAEQVDWGKVQPVAAQVSRALIAAVAAGQIPVGGRVGATVARAMTNQNGLGQKVVEQLDRSSSPLPEEFRRAIDTTSRISPIPPISPEAT